MAEAPSLGDFFKSKSKKKVKATNLNKAEEKKIEEKVKTSKEDDAWEEEQIVAATMKVEVAGKLMREEVKEEEDTSAPAWGNVSKSKDSATGQTTREKEMNMKRYPSLAKSVANVNIDDGSDAKVNITTSKNHFAALEGEDDDEGNSKKRPTEIAPAMVTKKKGEREKVALQREVNKYTKAAKKKAKKTSGDEDDDEEEEEDESEDEGDDDAEAEGREVKDAEAQEARKKKAAEKKEDKKSKKEAEEEEEEEPKEELEEDLKIQVDLVESKEKYKGRKKMAAKDLPREELQEEKENKPKPNQPSGKKKKFMVEEADNKLMAAPEGW